MDFSIQTWPQAFGESKEPSASGYGSATGLPLTRAGGFLAVPPSGSTKDKRDHAILSLLLGCGLRRAELTGLRLSDFQQRDEHWAIVNLFRKGGHIRTVPVPGWVKAVLDAWLHAPRLRKG